MGSRMHSMHLLGNGSNAYTSLQCNVRSIMLLAATNPYVACKRSRIWCCLARTAAERSTKNVWTSHQNQNQERGNQSALGTQVASSLVLHIHMPANTPEHIQAHVVSYLAVTNYTPHVDIEPIPYCTASLFLLYSVKSKAETSWKPCHTLRSTKHSSAQCAVHKQRDLSYPVWCLSAKFEWQEGLVLCLEPDQLLHRRSSRWSESSWWHRRNCWPSWPEHSGTSSSRHAPTDQYPGLECPELYGWS